MKLCIDCRYILLPEADDQEPEPDLERSKCAHYSAVMPGSASRVTGIVAPDVRITASLSRSWTNRGLCGPDAQHWEPKLVGFT
jgi:hypothetical protein